MKNNLFIALILMIFMFGVNLFAGIGRQNAQYAYTILAAGTTTYIVAVSSSIPTEFSYTNQSKGVQREINVESDTLVVKDQVGGSSTTVLTNGETLMPRSKSYFDVSMETIWLQAPAGSAPVNVCLTKIEKEK